MGMLSLASGLRFLLFSSKHALSLSSIRIKCTFCRNNLCFPFWNEPAFPFRAYPSAFYFVSAGALSLFDHGMRCSLPAASVLFQNSATLPFRHSAWPLDCTTEQIAVSSFSVQSASSSFAIFLWFGSDFEITRTSLDSLFW